MADKNRYDLPEQRAGNWNEYIVSDFKDGGLFVLSQKDGDYHVRYTVTLIDEHCSKLEYNEWSDSGNLESPFTQAALDRFKQVIES